MPDIVISPLERWMIPALVDLGEELMLLSEYQQPFDADYCRDLAEKQVASQNPNFMVWLAWTRENNNHKLDLCGVLLGSVSGMLFTPALMAVEETVYVRKGTPKRGLIANVLMEHFLHWAFTVKGASFARAGETSGIEPRAVNAFMRRNGFVKAGTLYKKDKPL